MNKMILKDVDERKEKIRAIYLLSFLLPLILLISMVISKHVFPFGDKCILRTDFYHQYFPFHSELQYKLKNFKSLFYTYNVGLGTNFITLLSYYLACPTNILLLFAPEKFLLEYITIILIIKISLCSLSFAYYAVHRYNTDSFAVIFFAIFYAMSGYIAAYYWDIMWIDNILIFPILMYGFEKMQDTGKPFLYIVTLAFSILFNYYIGVITCIFLFIYFIFYNVVKNNKFKAILKNLLKTGISSLLSIGISFILLLPIILAFKTTASSDSNFPKTVKEYFTIIEVVARHLPFVRVENGIEYWPNLYCGVIIFMLITLYFTSKKYKAKEKICYAFLILFFIASFSINALDYVWHVCKFPNSLPARQSFTYIFILLSLSIRPLLKINSIKEKDIVLSAMIPIVFLILIEKSVKNDRVGFYSIYAAIILLFIYMILFLCYKNKKYDKNIIIYVTIIIICMEAFFNMYQTSFSTIVKNDYMKNTDSIKKLSAEIKTMNDDFYRVERAVMRTKDDGAFMHFPSASIFSSSCYKDGSDFYKTFGMEASTNAYSTTGSTPFMDSLLSIRYKIFETEEKNAKALNKRYINNIEDVYLYQNLDTMPLSFVLPNKFLEDYDRTSGNPATVQNNFARTLNSDVLLVKQELDEKGKTATLKVEETGDYYAFIRDRSIKEVSVIYPNTTKTFKNMNRGYFIEVGYLEKGTDIEFRNDTNDDEILMEVFKFDFAAMKKLINKINDNYDYKMNYFDESYINYNMTSKIEGTCMLSLPYDDGFSIYVDGNKVEKKKVMDLFLGFDIKGGKHTIEVKYVPSGFMLGSLVTLLSIIITLAWFMVDRRKGMLKNE